MKRALLATIIPSFILFSASLCLAKGNANGKKLFDKTCSACHQVSGLGIPGVFPPVKNADYVKKAKPEQLIEIVLNGLKGPITVNGTKYNNVMAPLAKMLKDQEVADVLNYLVQDLNGNKKLKFSAAQVKKLRK